MEFIVCFQCGGNKLVPFISAQDFENPTRDLYHLEKCAACALVFQNPRPTSEELPKFYAPGKYYSYVELEKKESRQIGFLEKVRHALFERTMGFYYGGRRGPLDRVCAWIGKGRFGSTPLHLKPGKILDIGAGDGVFLDVVRRLGWEPHGVEINVQAAANASERGLNVHAGDLISARYPENNFDVVRIWSVLEHVRNPDAVLREIHRILKPGGLLILQVPNIDSLSYQIFGRYWTGLDLPRHITHFSPATLRMTLTGTGFQVQKLKFSSVGTALSSLQYWQKLKKKRFQQQPPRWLSWFYPVLRVANVFLDRVCDLTGKGDCMVAWAVKK